MMYPVTIFPRPCRPGFLVLAVTGVEGIDGAGDAMSGYSDIELSPSVAVSSTIGTNSPFSILIACKKKSSFRHVDENILT